MESISFVNENWKVIHIDNQETHYFVSDHGRVFNSKRGRLLKSNDWQGYERYRLRWNGKYHVLRGHRLVAMAFIPNDNLLDTVDHIDHDRKNNHYTNLRWMSLSDNSRGGFEVRYERYGK